MVRFFVKCKFADSPLLTIVTFQRLTGLIRCSVLRPLRTSTTSEFIRVASRPARTLVRRRTSKEV